MLTLDDAMKTAGVQASDYYETLTALYQQNGKTYGIPKDFGTLVVFVNDDMAQKADLDRLGRRLCNGFEQRLRRDIDGNAAEHGEKH